MQTAIITLDIMNDICHPDGKNARYSDRISERHVIENINKVTKWGRANSHLVIHVRIGFNPHYLDSSKRSKAFINAKKNQSLALQEWGGQYCDTLHIESSDIQVIKHRVSAFYGTDLDLILRANDVETLILTGVGTNMALELTTREAHDRDYLVTVVEDATECGSDEEKAASLKLLTRLATMKTTKDLI